ncbi:hypothetical protein MJ904_18855 [Massilia sp. MB5]|uniref:hypothetical protein n=1 Tax=Massilia sp. MB5 TaxID=2919578 RepID=UPI001F0D1294|nr:hypothetical protein [Massilia sp. MB5]UMR29141.1 hypothetical protein MJ904_18855 [Massilia sp. MB5]
MSRRHAPAMAAIATAAYFVLSIGALRAFAFDLPAELEQVLSMLAAPAMVLLLVWNPILHPLGLTSGEWVMAPNGAITLLIIALYSALAYGLVRLLCGPPPSR